MTFPFKLQSFCYPQLLSKQYFCKFNGFNEARTILSISLIDKQARRRPCVRNTRQQALMTRRERCELIKYLDIAVIDGGYDFTTQVTDGLRAAGLRNIYFGASIKYAEEILLNRHIDVLFLELDGKYAPLWKLVRTIPNLETVVIGTTFECCARTWLAGIEAGAERVIVKSQAIAAIEPLLRNLLEGECARRFRVVPFPPNPVRR